MWLESALECLGLSIAVQGDLAGAAAVYEETASLVVGPAAAVPLSFLAQMEYQLGHRDRALRELENAERYARQSPVAALHATLARAAISVGEGEPGRAVELLLGLRQTVDNSWYLANVDVSLCVAYAASERNLDALDLLLSQDDEAILAFLPRFAAVVEVALADALPQQAAVVSRFRDSTLDIRVPRAFLSRVLAVELGLREVLGETEWEALRLEGEARRGVDRIEVLREAAKEGRQALSEGATPTRRRATVPEAEDETIRAGPFVRVQLLGPFAIFLDDKSIGHWPRLSAKRLLALVFLSPKHRIAREVACDTLFGDLAPGAAANALHNAVSAARAVLADLGGLAVGLVRTDRTHIYVPLDAPVEVDLEVHRKAFNVALSMAPGDGRDAALVDVVSERRVLLEDEAYPDWVLRPRESLELARQEARLALARDRSLGFGRCGGQAVIEAWEAVFSHDPASEEAAAALMAAYTAQGQRQLAARTYSRCRVRPERARARALGGPGAGLPDRKTRAGRPGVVVRVGRPGTLGGGKSPALD